MMARGKSSLPWKVCPVRYIKIECTRQTYISRSISRGVVQKASVNIMLCIIVLIIIWQKAIGILVVVTQCKCIKEGKVYERVFTALLINTNKLRCSQMDEVGTNAGAT
jgi:hypothetical protein